MDDGLRERDASTARSKHPFEVTALRFAANWHRHSDVRAALEYHGVNLGEADEYLLGPEIMNALLEASSENAP